MFETLRQSLKTGVVTTHYPDTPPEVSRRARGQPEIDWANWSDARPAAAICPTGAIAYEDANGQRTARLDLAKCVFCGLCAEVDAAIRMTNKCELAARRGEDLVARATYSLKHDGTHEQVLTPPSPLNAENAGVRGEIEATGLELKKRINQVLGRSLHIREVDAGSCNGCEIEIVNLNSPVYDIERFGIHFVASPRHDPSPEAARVRSTCAVSTVPRISRLLPEETMMLGAIIGDATTASRLQFTGGWRYDWRCIPPPDFSRRNSSCSDHFSPPSV